MGIRIHVVDDSTTIRNLVVRCLSQAGHTVSESPDGAAGVKALRGTAVDLIVTDYNMPLLDGLGLIRQVRQLPSYRSTPILVLTTETSAEKKALAREAGATAWLVKPFNPDVLLSAIQRLMSRSPVGARK